MKTTGQIRIVSDGTTAGTRVLGPDGIRLTGVQSVVLYIDVKNALTKATVTFLDVEVDAVVTAEDDRGFGT